MSTSRLPWRASFGPFTLSPAQRLLERDGAHVRLGGRALDLLIELVDNAGRIVNKSDLMARVWADTIVDDGTLRFHVMAVRRALGDGEDGKRYIVNTAAKGYTFVAPVERHDLDEGTRKVAPARVRSLPAPGPRIVGRDSEIQGIVATLLERRLLSVVGSGGIGKTTVAIASAHAIAPSFGGDVHFVDLSTLSTQELVCSSVAATVGLQNRLDDSSALAAHLADRRCLLVLDCCEHVVAGVAKVAEALIRGCSQVRVLATSREPLGADGEFVVRLLPLAYPSDDADITAEKALAYPAVKLFVDRAAASGSGFVLTDGDAPLACRLCRELDGIPLSIELAAGRVEALGLRAIVSHFDASARLLWHGRRTAPMRQQTLNATLDWSYALLDDSERCLLRRLSVFAGTFSMDAALDVCAFDIDASAGMELLAGLVAKSLLNVDAGGAALRYGLFDTTRAYCARQLEASAETSLMAERFTAHFLALARQHADDRFTRESVEQLGVELPNLYAALGETFRSGSRAADAVEFVVAICPLLLQRGRLAECVQWARKALAVLPSQLVGSREEAWLQVHGSLGWSLRPIGEEPSLTDRAFRRAIEIAEGLRNDRDVAQLTNGYVVSLHRAGRFADALACARRAQSLWPRLEDPESREIVDSFVGASCHLVGDLRAAGPCLERAVERSTGPSFETTSKLGFDHNVRSLSSLARNLWFTGDYARAAALAEQAISKARGADHAVSHCLALIWAGAVFGWQGDVEKMAETADALESVARRHAFTPYLSIVAAARGRLLIGRRTAEGVELIRSAIEGLHASRYEMMTTELMTELARGLSELSLHDASLAICAQTARVIKAGGDFLRMPELLRVRGNALAAAGRAAEAVHSHEAALALARSQGAAAGELRAAIALATMWKHDGRSDEARELLRPLVNAAGDQPSIDLSMARDLSR